MTLLQADNIRETLLLSQCTESFRFGGTRPYSSYCTKVIHLTRGTILRNRRAHCKSYPQRVQSFHVVITHLPRIHCSIIPHLRFSLPSILFSLIFKPFIPCNIIMQHQPLLLHINGFRCLQIMSLNQKLNSLLHWGWSLNETETRMDPIH